MQVMTGAKFGAIVSGAVLSMGVLVGLPYAAYAAETQMVFSLAGGGLSITAPAKGPPALGPTIPATIAGPLAPISVDDARRSTTGWIASVSATGFVVADSTIAASDINYVPGAISSTGTVTVTSSVASTLEVPKRTVAATSVIGNHTVSWSPEITITLPRHAVPVDYWAVITHSVL